MVEILDNIIQLAQKYNTEIYLTGGAVRDILLDREIDDFDFTVKNKTKEISSEFSDIISGTHIILDRKNEIYRVVKNNIDYDFTALKESNIKKDLIKRDFTINSLAIHYQNFDTLKKHFLRGNYHNLDKKIFIDPTQGMSDLENSLIKVNDPKNFDNDPLRLLRAVRFKAVLNFDIEKETEKNIFNKRKLINNSAPERIRYELLKIFETNQTREIVEYMENNLKLFSTIFPEIEELKKLKTCFSKKISNWIHSIDMLESYKKFSSQRVIDFFLSRNNGLFMKFAIIFHGYGKDKFSGQEQSGAKKVAKIFRDLKFSNKEIKYIKTLIAYHGYILRLYNENNVTDEKIYEFFVEVEEYAPDIIFLAALDYESAKNFNDNYEKDAEFWSFINKLLSKYETMIKSIKNPILTGKDIMNILNIKESPLVGEYLNKLKKQQALGKIDKKSDAVSYLKNLEINKENNN